MNKQEIAQHVASVHNRLTQIMVSGDNAILMGDSLRELRYLVQELQKDMETEEAAEKMEQDER